MREYADFTFKLLFVGDDVSGKTSIINRFIDDTYCNVYNSTIGVDFKIKLINLFGKKIKLQIWDTSGDQRFKTIIASYYKKINGFILVYDVTNKKTFENIDKWLIGLQNFAHSNAVILLVGNKSDSINRQVSVEEGIDKANQLGMLYIEASAKENININKIFQLITDKIMAIDMAINNELTGHIHMQPLEIIDPIKTNQAGFFQKFCNIL